MKTNVIWSHLVMAIVMVLSMTMTSCNWPWQGSEDDDETPYVGKRNLSFEAVKGDVKELSIVCSGRWSIENVPSWLTAESTEGTGQALVKFTTNRANLSSTPNEALMSVTFDEDASATATVCLIQLGGAIASCEVIPNLIVSLSNGIASDFTCDKDVSWYFRGYIQTAYAGVMSEEEIISQLKRDFSSRHVPSEDEVADFDGLEPGTSYLLYTLAYDKDGNRGNLVATEVSTLPRRNNDPVARIDNVCRNGAYWNWTVTKSASCDSYYMMTTENYAFANASDVLQAWVLEYAAGQGTINEYVNGTDWMQEIESGSFFFVWTRGMDKRGNMSGTINWNYFSSSTTRSAAVQKENASKDHSSRKPSPGHYKLYRIE